MWNDGTLPDLVTRNHREHWMKTPWFHLLDIHYIAWAKKNYRNQFCAHLSKDFKILIKRLPVDRLVKRVLNLCSCKGIQDVTSTKKGISRPWIFFQDRIGCEETLRRQKWNDCKYSTFSKTNMKNNHTAWLIAEWLWASYSEPRYWEIVWVAKKFRFLSSRFVSFHFVFCFVFVFFRLFQEEHQSAWNILRKG